MTIRELFVC